MKIICTIKGQIIPKADWSAMDPPKKRTDKFVFLLVYSSQQNKQQQKTKFVHSFVFERIYGAKKNVFEIN